MHCPSDVYEYLDEIPCPKAREIKETGWCRLKYLCVKASCHFCDDIRHHFEGIDEIEKSEEKYLHCWTGFQSTIYDIKSMRISDLPPQFPIEALPRDIFLYLLRFMLVSDETITNPYLQHRRWYKKHPKTLEEIEGGIVRYSWSKNLRPSILATSKFYFSLGMKMLYRYNIFRFTHLVAQTGNQWAEFCTLPDEMTDDVPIIDKFLGFKHCLLPEVPVEEGTKLNRSCLMKKVIIEESDLDSDYYAKRGIGKSKPLTCGIDKYRYMFHIFTKFVKFGGNLSDLTITIDEEEPDVLDQIAFEEHLISPKRTSLEEGERQAWKNGLAKKGKKALTRKWEFASSPSFAKMMTVDHIHIRGTDAVAGGRLYFEPSPKWREFIDDIHVSGNYLPTSKVAESLLSYFEGRCFARWIKNKPMLSFSGKFSQRRLKSDGTFVPDDELEAWTASEARKAQEAIERAKANGAAENLHPLVVFI